MENSPARPRSKLMLSRSIQGEGSGTVSMVLQVDGAVPGAVTMVGVVSGLSAMCRVGETASSAGPCGGPSGGSSGGPSGGVITSSSSAISSAVIAGVNVVILLVLTIYGSVSKRRLRGFQPRSEIACRFVLLLPNERGQIKLTRGKMSLFSMSELNPILVRNRTSFDFSRTHSTFHDPFCSFESPTCHLWVPLGRPMQKTHR